MAEPFELMSDEEISVIRKSASIASKVLLELKKNIKPGVSALELDKTAYKLIKSSDAEPAFLGYRGYPATICFSVNNELVHGIPTGKKIIREGDIVTVDLGVVYKGFYGDIAETGPVGRVSESRKKLLEITYGCFDSAFKQCSGSKRVGDLGSAVQNFVE